MNETRIESKAERTEECARLCDAEREKAAWLGGERTAKILARQIRSLTQKDTPHNAE